MFALFVKELVKMTEKFAGFKKMYYLCNREQKRPQVTTREKNTGLMRAVDVLRAGFPGAASVKKRPHEGRENN